MNDFLRQLPAIHELQAHQDFTRLIEEYKLKQEYLTNLLREITDGIRNQLLEGSLDKDPLSKNEWIEQIFLKARDYVKRSTRYYLKTTINATGTVLHTNLGRARLSEAAVNHVINISKSYSNLEYDLSDGKRGSRHSVVEELIKRLTGAEAAMVVNNNAAAVFLILRALAKEKEVIVSRGQLVEIGGSFRISAIMEESGAKLVEVGTTNKTHATDYEEAITENTAMILKVHTSNFKTIGFTKTVEVAELVSIRSKYEKVVIYEDLGSGVLYDFKKHGLGNEPLVKDVLDQGVDLVSFSGDKLLGGPQAGIIVGKKRIVDQLKKHQLARVLRVDKMTYAALEATLHSYYKGDYLEVPTIRDILKTKEEVKQRSNQFIELLKKEGTRLSCAIMEDGSPIGGGTMPGVEVPTVVVVLKHPTKTAQEIYTALKNHTTPIITRIKHEEVLLDFRTISKNEMIEIIKACNSV